jgi:hypothetical protein
MNIEEMTLGEIMGEDHYVRLMKSEKFGYDMEVIREETEESATWEDIHPYALDSLALFARRFLKAYDALQHED